jgi:hypothetical protein
MEALPTELDVKILGYVRQGDYSAMVDMERVTRVSKYYRNIGQPLLYQRVTLYHDEADRIKLLLMTLLGRKDLRKHLHHLRILHCDTPQGGVIARDNEFVNLPYDHTQGDVFYERLASHLTNIKTTIDEIAIPYMSAQIRMIWVSKVLQPFPGFDGALALIIGMAKNIVAVELELAGKHSLTTALDFLRLQGQHPVRTLQKLESVRLNGAPRDFSITMLPDQKDMRVKANVDMYDNRADIGLRGLQTPRSPYGAPSLLATLHLRNVTFDPRDLEPLIRSKWLRNIKTLAITGLPSSWSTYNYTYLTTVMEENLLRLEDLENPLLRSGNQGISKCAWNRARSPPLPLLRSLPLPLSSRHRLRPLLPTPNHIHLYTRLLAPHADARPPHPELLPASPQHVRARRGGLGYDYAVLRLRVDGHAQLYLVHAHRTRVRAADQRANCYFRYTGFERHVLRGGFELLAKDG